MKKLLILIIIVLLAVTGFFIINIVDPDFFLRVSTLDSGIEGNIAYGPTSPVCKINESCNKPYNGKILIKSSDKSRVIQTFTTDKNGSFRINIQPGTYYLETKQEFINACGQPVKVEIGKFTDINLECDTGIR